MLSPSRQPSPTVLWNYSAVLAVCPNEPAVKTAVHKAALAEAARALAYHDIDAQVNGLDIVAGSGAKTLDQRFSPPDPDDVKDFALTRLAEHAASAIAYPGYTISHGDKGLCHLCARIVETGQEKQHFTWRWNAAVDLLSNPRNWQTVVRVADELSEHTSISRRAFHEILATTSVAPQCACWHKRVEAARCAEVYEGALYSAFKA